jgi:invasion protein IalB
MNKRLTVALSVIAGFGIASMALAQAPQQQQQQAQAEATPSGWSYTIKEKSAAGEYKESRSCDD